MNTARDVLKRGKRYVPAVRDKLRTLKPGDDGPAAPAAEPDAAPAAPAPEPSAPPPHEAFLRAMLRGDRIDVALVAQIYALNAAGEPDTARALAESLRGRAETEALGRLTAGVVAARRGYRALAWEELSQVPHDVWGRFAAAEFVRSGLLVAPDAALPELRALIEADPEEVRARHWYAIATALWGFGDEPLAREAFARFERHMDADDPPWEPGIAHREHLRPWIASAPDSPTRPATGRRTFAVLDYGHPSPTKASPNIGDHIQTLAALGHLVRHRNVRLHGDDDLVGLLEELRAGALPAASRTDIDADVDVMAVHRDASTYAEIPEDTWVLAFGWFMHALFHMRHAFPLHANLRPIFVSFHCNKRDMLTPEAIDYLKRYAPIGCRDWTTVDLLLSLDVPAFFSGCVTTTTDVVLGEPTAPPPRTPGPRTSTCPRPTARRATSTRWRRSAAGRSPPTSARRCSCSRRTAPARRSSPRACTPTCRSARSASPSTSAPPTGPTSASRGSPASTTRSSPACAARWSTRSGRSWARSSPGSPRRRSTRCGASARRTPWPRPARGTPARCSCRRRRGDRHAGAPVDRGDEAPRARGRSPPTPSTSLAFLPADAGLGLSVLVASLLEHASRPLHLHVIARPGAEAEERVLAERFPALRVDWIPTRGYAGTIANPDGSRPDAKGLIRLLLPDLLPDVDRLAIFDLPSVALGDVAELAALDLGGHALAAPTRTDVDATSGFGLLHDAAARLGDRADAATELRRAAHARHAFDFDAFDAHVLVLDLARMRADGFTAQALPLIPAFGLDHLEVLHFLAGPGRAELRRARWSAIPTRSPARDPQLLHWAGRREPVPGRAHAAAGRVARRRGRADRRRRASAHVAAQHAPEPDRDRQQHPQRQRRRRPAPTPSRSASPRAAAPSCAPGRASARRPRAPGSRRAPPTRSAARSRGRSPAPRRAAPRRTPMPVSIGTTMETAAWPISAGRQRPRRGRRRRRRPRSPAARRRGRAGTRSARARARRAAWRPARASGAARA